MVHRSVLYLHTYTLKYAFYFRCLTGTKCLYDWNILACLCFKVCNLIYFGREMIKLEN